MRYEKFKVIAGSEKEELNFYSTFFTGSNKFKKGEIYELSTPGDFVQDSSEIIQGINNGGHEFERVYSSLMIKELWEEKAENIERLSILEEDLKKKKEDVNKINQELSGKKGELTSLQSRFDSLQLEKRKGDEKISLLEKNIQTKEQEINRVNQELRNSETKTNQLQSQLTSLQTEKTKVENEWINPEKAQKLFKEQENLKKQLKTERKDKQFLIESLEELRSQELKGTMEAKLVERKKELDQLKVKIVEKLANSQSLLENFLEKQEDFDIALFDDVSQAGRAFLRVKDRLQDAKDKLIAKIGSEKVEELCKIQTEIGKLETSQRQWEKMEEQQKKEEQERFESFVGTPPATPRNGY
ncbi:hypothetical protein [endosymbiont GvMRE of Glomus versiforme]|uniref:hypothetical protein n=1 Tax=endosymbiont GvMRE of Glomus versiforme TaxID=2039283 RepID=UPI0011C422E2|nr:hypothetical protein [endosymbiont GvMRE of Glomus versiforme]